MLWIGTVLWIDAAILMKKNWDIWILSVSNANKTGVK